MNREAGLTLIETLFAAVLIGTVTAMAVPWTAIALDRLRTASAARYVAARIVSLRLEAVRRSTAVAIRFEPDGDDYSMAAFEDGNGNGVRTADIRAGIDRALGLAERLRDKFPGVRFALGPDACDVDGAESGGGDGIRIGSARILTMTADGTATSGTVYIRGERGQFAVRVLGITGRTRVLEYVPGARTWMSR